MKNGSVTQAGFAHRETPVVVLNGQLGALAIMRSLGPLGIPLYVVSNNYSDPAMRSRYCRERFALRFEEERPEPYLELLLALGKRLGGRSILIPTSDVTAQFVADHADVLRPHFRFQENSSELVSRLSSKREMFQLALNHRVPTPHTVFPRNLEDVLAYAQTGTFPIMLKGIHGSRLQARAHKPMVIVNSPDELLDAYRRMEDPLSPNLMIQELIPGADDQVYIFNGYFNDRSECLVGFTGFKVRQYPVHIGCASLGECRQVDEVARLTVDFMRAIGYRGILDIGYRLDPRDGSYKVLDINPRVGQAFRLFVAENDHDVVKALYLDFTGQEQPPVVAREGRRWAIEDFDLVSSLKYYQEGSLGAQAWARSFRGLEEVAWFNWHDPAPVLEMFNRLARQFGSWAAKRLTRQGPHRSSASQGAVA